MSAIDSAILQKLLASDHAYVWCDGERMGIETGIDLTRQEGARVDELLAKRPRDVYPTWSAWKNR